MNNLPGVKQKVTMMEALAHDVCVWKPKKGKELALKIIGRSMIDKTRVEVQKTTAHGLHGVFSIDPSDIIGLR